jgi:hypothetical protein
MRRHHDEHASLIEEDFHDAADVDIPQIRQVQRVADHFRQLQRRADQGQKWRTSVRIDRQPAGRQALSQ